MDDTAKRISRIAAIAGVALFGAVAVAPVRAQTMSTEQLAAGCNKLLANLDQGKDPDRQEAQAKIDRGELRESQRNAWVERHYKDRVFKACAPPAPIPGGNFTPKQAISGPVRIPG